MTMIRKSITGAIAALALGATVMASASPAAADWRGHHHRGGGGWGAPVAAGIIGGLALGAFAAQAAPRSYAPTYYATPAYSGDCTEQDQPTYNRWGRFIGYRTVTVCD